MFKMSIPEISNEELRKLYERIKPVVRVNGSLHYLREFSLEELRRISYLWSATENVREEVKDNELEVMEGRDFVCLHTYGYPGFFKPTIGEVLSQLDENDIPLVKAFEIIECPEVSEDFYKDSFTTIAFKNRYHVSTVRLYREKA